MKNRGYAKFGGGGGQIRCIMGDVQVAYYRVFSLTWPTSMQIYGTKESVCVRREFNSHRIGLGHQYGRRFIVLGHQYGRRDVM